MWLLSFIKHEPDGHILLNSLKVWEIFIALLFVVSIWSSIPDDRPSPIQKHESKAQFADFMEHVKELVTGEQVPVEMTSPKTKSSAEGQQTKHVKG